MHLPFPLLRGLRKTPNLRGSTLALLAATVSVSQACSAEDMAINRSPQNATGGFYEGWALARLGPDTVLWSDGRVAATEGSSGATERNPRDRLTAVSKLDGVVTACGLREWKDEYGVGEGGKLLCITAQPDGSIQRHEVAGDTIFSGVDDVLLSEGDVLVLAWRNLRLHALRVDPKSNRIRSSITLPDTPSQTNAVLIDTNHVGRLTVARDGRCQWIVDELSKSVSSPKHVRTKAMDVPDFPSCQFIGKFTLRDKVNNNPYIFLRSANGSFVSVANQSSLKFNPVSSNTSPPDRAVSWEQFAIVDGTFLFNTGEDSAEEWAVTASSLSTGSVQKARIERSSISIDGSAELRGFIASASGQPEAVLSGRFIQISQVK